VKIICEFSTSLNHLPPSEMMVCFHQCFYPFHQSNTFNIHIYITNHKVSYLSYLYQKAVCKFLIFRYPVWCKKWRKKRQNFNWAEAKTLNCDWEHGSIANLSSTYKLVFNQILRTAVKRVKSATRKSILHHYWLDSSLQSLTTSTTNPKSQISTLP